jgi:hypothetical protein
MLCGTHGAASQFNARTLECWYTETSTSWKSLANAAFLLLLKSSGAG